MTLTGLGTQLRHVLDLMDGDIATVLADLGVAGYRPRFSPVVRALVALGPVPIRELASAISGHALGRQPDRGADENARPGRPAARRGCQAAGRPPDREGP